jgi:hypothetical protein
LVKDLESIRPSAIVDIIYSGEAMAAMVKKDGMGRKAPVQRASFLRVRAVYID